MSAAGPHVRGHDSCSLPLFPACRYAGNSGDDNSMRVPFMNMGRASRYISAPALPQAQSGLRSLPSVAARYPFAASVRWHCSSAGSIHSLGRGNGSHLKRRRMN
eukprot:gene11320-biopygen5299